MSGWSAGWAGLTNWLCWRGCERQVWAAAGTGAGGSLRYSLLASTVLCVECASRSVWCVETNPIHPIQSVLLARLRTSPLSTQETFVLSAHSHQTTSNSPGESFPTPSTPIGPIHSLSLPSSSAPVHHFLCLVPALARRREPPFWPCTDEPTFMVSPPLKTQHQLSSPLLLGRTRSLEACDRVY